MKKKPRKKRIMHTGVGAEIQRLRVAYKKRSTATGQMYNAATEQRRKYRNIVLWGLFVSDENTFLLRPHLFTREKSMTPSEWNEWLRTHYGTILRENLLPGMEGRTGKEWRLYRVIGWTAGDNTKIKNPTTRKARNKTKQARG